MAVKKNRKTKAKKPPRQDGMLDAAMRVPMQGVVHGINTRYNPFAHIKMPKSKEAFHQALQDVQRKTRYDAEVESAEFYNKKITTAVNEHTRDAKMQRRNSISSLVEAVSVMVQAVARVVEDGDKLP